MAITKGQAEKEELDYKYNWSNFARPNQILPDYDTWDTALFLTGRGWGLTRTGAQAVIDAVQTKGYRHISIVLPTAADIISTIILGESGIIKNSHPDNRPSFNQTKMQLKWPNGAIANCFSSEKPERMRGPQSDFVWIDNPAANFELVYGLASFSLRLESEAGNSPKMLITSSPKPFITIADLHDSAKSDTSSRIYLVQGHALENKDNLHQRFLDIVENQVPLGEQVISSSIISSIEPQSAVKWELKLNFEYKSQRDVAVRHLMSRENEFAFKSYVRDDRGEREYIVEIDHIFGSELKDLGVFIDENLEQI